MRPIDANDHLIIFSLIDNTTTLPMDIDLSIEFYTKENHHRFGEANFGQILNKANR
jgi:hypothetical protein